MINVMCLQLCLKYPNPEYIGGAVVNTTHYIGVDDSIRLNKATIDKIALAMVNCHRKNLSGIDDNTVVKFYVSSFSHLMNVDKFIDFANTKKALMVDGVCLPYIHAQESGDSDG